MSRQYNKSEKKNRRLRRIKRQRTALKVTIAAKKKK